MGCEADLNCGDLLIGNSMDVRLLSVKVRGEIVDDATVTVTVKASGGATVAGADELPMPADVTPGDYLGTIPATLELVKNGRYQVIVQASKGDLGVGKWTCWRVAKEREC